MRPSVWDSLVRQSFDLLGYAILAAFIGVVGFVVVLGMLDVNRRRNGGHRG